MIAVVTPAEQVRNSPALDYDECCGDDARIGEVAGGLVERARHRARPDRGECEPAGEERASRRSSSGRAIRSRSLGLSATTTASGARSERGPSPGGREEAAAVPGEERDEQETEQPDRDRLDSSGKTSAQGRVRGVTTGGSMRLPQ